GGATPTQSTATPPENRGIAPLPPEVVCAWVPRIPSRQLWESPGHNTNDFAQVCRRRHRVASDATRESYAADCHHALGLRHVLDTKHRDEAPHTNCGDGTDDDEGQDYGQGQDDGRTLSIRLTCQI